MIFFFRSRFVVETIESIWILFGPADGTEIPSPSLLPMSSPDPVRLSESLQLQLLIPTKSRSIKVLSYTPSEKGSMWMRQPPPTQLITNAASFPIWCLPRFLVPRDLVSLSHQSLSSGTAVFGMFFLTLPQGVSGEAEMNLLLPIPNHLKMNLLMRLPNPPNNSYAPVGDILRLNLMLGSVYAWLCFRNDHFSSFVRRNSGKTPWIISL